MDNIFKNKWFRLLIIAVIVIVVIVAAILIIKHFKRVEKFEVSDLPAGNWVDAKATIGDFVKGWKSTVQKVYQKPENETYVSSRQILGSAQRKYQQAVNVSNPKTESYKEPRVGKTFETYQESRLRKKFETPLSGLSVMTGENYKY